MKQYAATLQRFREVIRDLYGCDSVHKRSVPMRETLDGCAWHGTIEVFSLIGHPAATTVYVWSRDGRERCYATLLAVDPVKTPLDAVRRDIAADLRTKRSVH